MTSRWKQVAVSRGSKVSLVASHATTRTACPGRHEGRVLPRTLSGVSRTEGLRFTALERQAGGRARLRRVPHAATGDHEHPSHGGDGPPDSVACPVGCPRTAANASGQPGESPLWTTLAAHDGGGAARSRATWAWPKAGLPEA